MAKEIDELPDDIGQLQDMLREAKARLRQVQLELDVREATLEIVKKGLFGGFCGRDSGIGPAQRAKTTIWN